MKDNIYEVTVRKVTFSKQVKIKVHADSEDSAIDKAMEIKGLCGIDYSEIDGVNYIIDDVEMTSRGGEEDEHN
jgi:hypothetical protein